MITRHSLLPPVVDYFPDGNSGSFVYTLGGDGVVTDPVSNVQTLSVDGNLDDWSQLQSFGVDGDDISGASAQADILKGWMAHDAWSLYVAYRNDGNINTLIWWPWQFVTNATNSVNDAVVELKIPRSAIGNPVGLRAIFKARNGIFNGDYNETTGTDSYPNLGSGYLTDVLGSSGFSNAVASNSILLNGNLSDWGQLQSFGSDANDINMIGAKADLLETWMVHDSSNLYFAYRNDSNIDTETWWTWQIFIDTDDNINIGYEVGLSLVAKYMIQGGALYAYNGSGTNWSWQYISSIATGVAGAIAELSIPQSAIGSQTSLSVVFKASNWVLTGDYAEAGTDYTPDTARTSLDGYFSYTVSQ